MLHRACYLSSARQTLCTACIFPKKLSLKVHATPVSFPCRECIRPLPPLSCVLRTSSTFGILYRSTPGSLWLRLPSEGVATAYAAPYRPFSNFDYDGGVLKSGEKMIPGLIVKYGNLDLVLSPSQTRHSHRRLPSGPSFGPSSSTITLFWSRRSSGQCYH